MCDAVVMRMFALRGDGIGVFMKSGGGGRCGERGSGFSGVVGRPMRVCCWRLAGRPPGSVCGCSARAPLSVVRLGASER